MRAKWKQIAAWAAAALWAVLAVPKTGGQPTQVAAHRAGAALGAENTVAALRESIRRGAAWAEIDVRRTGDGVLVALHDETLERVAGVPRRVEDMTIAELRCCNVGGSGKAQCIPTLAEMAAEAAGRAVLMVELKDGGAVAEAVELLRRMNRLGDCWLGAFDLRWLERAKSLAPELQTVYITAKAPATLQGLNAADSISVQAACVTPRLLAEARALGKQVWVWTVNDSRTAARLAALGVDGVVTDDPGMALAAVAGR